MKSTWFGDKHRAEFGKCLHAIDSGMQYWDLLRIFLEAASATLTQGTLAMFGRFNREMEEQYAQAVSRVRHPEKLPECLAILVRALDENAYDFLGSFMQELGLNDKSCKGQCFTPPAVCELMARMTLGDLSPSEKRLLIDEPAVGGGAMIIAGTHVLKERGFGPHDFLWQATDVDWRMAAVSFIQLTLLDIPAIVRWGNTISQEVWKKYTTFCAMRYPTRSGMSRSLELAKEASQPVVTERSRPVQLSLF